jgi:tetratricopeptide (TPR) repeat protein
MYGCDEVELGLSDDAGAAAVIPRVAPVMSSETVAYFRNVFREHVLADNLMGPQHLVEVVRAQTALLDQVLANARGRIRDELLHLACRYNEFTGWLCQDAGEPNRAMFYSDRAMDYAMEIDDPRESAYVLMRKSHIACDQRNGARALGLTMAALRDGSRLPPRIRALILGQRARACALVGDVDGSVRAVDAALREADRSDASSDDLAAYCNLSYVAMETASSLQMIGKAEDAISIYERGRSAWPAGFRRDLGLCLSRLANAYAVRGDAVSATATGRDAIDVVRSATSSRAILELQRLRGALAPWRRVEEVSELAERIRGLTRRAA